MFYLCIFKSVVAFKGTTDDNQSKKTRHLDGKNEILGVQISGQLIILQTLLSFLPSVPVLPPARSPSLPPRRSAAHGDGGPGPPRGAQGFMGPEEKSSETREGARWWEGGGGTRPSFGADGPILRCFAL